MNKIVEQGGAIIMISSELSEVLNICDGRITGEFFPEEVDADTIMDRAVG